MFNLFKDLENNDLLKLFEKTQFLASDTKYNSEIKNSNLHTVMEIVLELIKTSKFEKADYLINKFPSYIKQNFNKYCYKNIPETSILDGLQKCVEAISEKYNNEFSKVCLLEIFNAFKDYVEILKFKELLDHDMPLKITKQLQRKI